VASLNKVLLIGNLTRPVETRYTPQGMAVGELGLAVNRRYKTQDGETHEETCFVRVTVWGRQAETCAQYLSKGSPCLVEGRLKYDEWEKDGVKSSRLTVVAERVQFLGSPKGGAGDQGSQEDGAAPRGPGNAPAAAPTPPPAERVADEVRGDDENLPF
jgi:single-strand DNA-binding protein